MQARTFASHFITPLLHSRSCPGHFALIPQTASCSRQLP